MPNKLLAIILVVVGGVIGSFGALFLKKGTNKVSFKLKDWLTNHKLMIGGLFYGVSATIYIYALRFAELSLLYPFVSTTFIWVNLWSFYFLKEDINKWKWLSIIFIILGVIIIGFGNGTL